MNKNINIIEIGIDELMEDDAVLVEEARKAVELSYSPYSNFSVGAAALLDNGKIVRGANQENVSYPVGICAERSTIYTAQNLYPNVPVLSIALAAKGRDGEFTKDYVTPCGMCRQAISELENRYQRQIRILMCSAHKVAIVDTINSLLPMSFI
jgi:cytidine deaminase